MTTTRKEYLDRWTSPLRPEYAQDHTKVAEERKGKTITRTLWVVFLAALWFIVAQTATASAQPALTHEDTIYISSLAEEGIYPSAGYTAADLINNGHAIAINIQRGYTPQSEANSIFQAGQVTMGQARWIVGMAVTEYSPDNINAVPDYFFAPIGKILGKGFAA